MQKRSRATGFGGLAVGLWALSLLLFVELGLSPQARAFDDGRCVYNRGLYESGTVMCQGSQCLRCEAGAWGEIGMCHGDESPPEPITSGGDRVEDPEQER